MGEFYESAGLSGAWAALAREQVQEPEEQEAAAVLDQLRSLVSAAYSELPEEQLEEVNLKRYLRATLWDPEAALELLQATASLLAAHPQYLLPLAESCHASPVFWVAPGRDEQGSRVVFLRMAAWDPTTVPAEKLFSFTTSMFQLLSTEPRTQVGGVVFITDLTGFGFRHLRALGINELRYVGTFLSGSFPINFRAVHFVNNPRLFNALYAILKGFLSEKIKNCVKFHGYSTAELVAEVPAALLPEVLGGTCPEAELAPEASLAALQEREKEVAAGLAGVADLEGRAK